MKSINAPLIPFFKDANIYLKLENLQPFGSYKIRGIENIIKNEDPKKIEKGLIAASAGNMGQALAYIAKENDLPCTIVVPDSAPTVKIERIKSLGAEVLKRPYAEVWKMVEKGYVENSNKYFIHPSDNQFLLEGYSQIAKEIIQDIPDVNRVIIPYGVGGLTLGVGSYLKEFAPKCRVETVEPETAHPVSRFLKADDRSTIVPIKSLVDAIGTPCLLPRNCDLLRSIVDEANIVPIEDVKAAIKSLYMNHHVIAEGAGAASLAAAMATPIEGKTVCIISGGNIDQSELINCLTSDRDRNR